MSADTSWDALSNPGLATDYFNLSEQTPLQSGTKCFSTSNAWWLAEITRLSYHRNYHNKQDINLGGFKFEKIAVIDNTNTSTHVSLLQVIGIDINGVENTSLVIAFRGTDDLADWQTNINVLQQPYANAGKVHTGFKEAYFSIRDELHGHLNNNSLPLFVTGHSLGAALATLTTADIYNTPHFDSCYTFGSPRTGNPAFVDSIQCENIYRVVNNCDVVTTVPLDFGIIEYRHIGASYLLTDAGKLIDNMDEDEIVSYQKNKLHELKEYAATQIFSRNINQFSDKLPMFLYDHSPINYVTGLESLL